MKTLLTNNPEKAKFLMIFFACIIFTGVVLSLIAFKLGQEDNTPIYSRENATLSMDHVNHTETSDGVRQWNLEAETADYFKKENTALFTKIRVKLFSAKDEMTVITADKGKLDTDTGDITLTGNVSGIRGTMQIESDTLVYNKAEHKVSSPVRTKVHDTVSDLSGDTFMLEINSEKLVMKGNVALHYQVTKKKGVF